jgi:hypothetical protein
MMDSTSGKFKMTRDEELLYKIVYEKIRSTGVKPPPVGVFIKKSDQYTLLSESCVTLSEFAKVANLGKMNRLTQVKLYKMFSDTTIDELRERQIPVGVKTVLNMSGQFSNIIDKHFPDYVKSGLFPILFK